MKIHPIAPLTLCAALLLAATACSKSKKEAPKTAAAPEDTMLLHDLAEANKNTANAAAMDNSLTTLRTSGDSQTAIVGSSGSSETPQTRVNPAASTNSSATVQTAGSTSAPTTRTRTTRQSDSDGTVTSRQPARTTSSSGDPCDSPTPSDQRTCLNRSIVENDADLNSTYQALIAQSRTSGGPDLEARLREAQRAWVNDRDMACRPSNDSGLWARPVARCLADYSARRTAELRRTLSSLRGQ
jgi:uncharacterized protein YecT (DUF1311 family)